MRRVTFLLLVIVFYLNVKAQYEQDGIFYQNGLELLDSSKFESAIYYFNKAINVNPEISIYYHNRGYAKFMVKDFEGAISDYKKASSLVPEESLYYFLIGNTFYEQGKYVEAISNFTTAIQLNNNDYIYFFNRGNLYLKLYDYANAILDYNETIQLNPQHYGAYNNRAISKLKLNDKQSACEDWELAKEYGFNIADQYLHKYCSSSELNTDNINIEIVKEDKSISNKIVKNETPQFNYNGLTNFGTFVGGNLKYPIYSMENGHQGTVILKFYVTKDNSIDSIIVINSVTRELDDEAVRIIKLSEGYWKSGKINGKNVNLPVIMPIKFTLSNTFKSKTVRSSTSNYKYTNNTSNRDYNEKNIIKDITVYYDSIWQITTKEKASYYRIANWDAQFKFYTGKYTDYNIEGIKFAEGNYSGNLRNGSYVLFYPSGQVMCRGYYVNHKPSKTWYFYYENGKLKQKVNFTFNSFYIESFYNEKDSLLVENGTGSWYMKLRDGLKSSDILYEGEFLNCKKTGFWKMYLNSTLIINEKYKNGKFVRGSYKDPETNRKTILYEETLGSWIFNPVNLDRTEQMLFDSSTTNSDYNFNLK